METGVIIARFQTPYLHAGHINLINNVRAKHNRLVIVLGVSPLTGTKKNPFDYYTREKLIKAVYDDIIVLPLADHPSDDLWSNNLDTLLENTFPGTTFKIYGSRDSFIPFYDGKYRAIELAEHGKYNATELRNKYADKVYESKDFRAGILYAVHNQYKKVYPTVDIAVFKDNKKQILLARKANSDKWRLIGGFVDPNDDNYETAAERELYEEIGQVEIGPMNYEMNQKINDWRYKNEDDKIITTLFSCDLIFGAPEAQDDIAEVQWFETKDLTNMINQFKINTEHMALISELIDKYK